MALFKEGWIEYRKRGTIKSHWTTKWLELRRMGEQSCLRLYNDRSKSNVEKEILLPESGVAVRIEHDLQGKRFQFGFTVSFGTKNYSFAADKSPLRGEWASAIENAAQHDPNMNFAMYNRHSSKAYAVQSEDDTPGPPQPPGPPPQQAHVQPLKPARTFDREKSQSPRDSRRVRFDAPEQSDNGAIPPPPPPPPGNPQLQRYATAPDVMPKPRRSVDDLDLPLQPGEMAMNPALYSQSERVLGSRGPQPGERVVAAPRVKRIKFKKKFNPSKPSSILLWGRSRVENMFPENSHTHSPFQHEGLSRRQFVDVVAAKSGHHFFGITLEGWVVTWGACEPSDAATRGNPMGIGGSIFVAAPTMLRALSKREVTKVACSSLHALALTNRDEIFGWGDRTLTGLPTASHEPMVIDHLTGNRTEGIACSDTHSLVWSNVPRPSSAYRSSVTSFGHGGAWLGLGPGNDRVNFGEVQFDSSIQPDNEVVLAECGPRYSFLVFNDGRICTFGVNNSGRMGVTVKKTSLLVWLNLPPCFAVSAAHEHAAFITTNGQLFTTGNGGYNRLGHPGNAPVWEPQLVEFLQDTKVAQVLCVQARTYVLTDQGCILMWGLEDTQEHVHQVPTCIEFARAYRMCKIAGCMDSTTCLGSSAKRDRVSRPSNVRFQIVKNQRSLFYQSTSLPQASPRQTPTNMQAHGLGGFSLMDRHLAQNFAPASMQPVPMQAVAQPAPMQQPMMVQQGGHQFVVYQQPQAQQVQYVMDASGRAVPVVQQQYQYAAPTQQFYQQAPPPPHQPYPHSHHAHAASMQIPMSYQHTSSPSQVVLQQTPLPPHEQQFAQVTPSPEPMGAPRPDQGAQQYYYVPQPPDASHPSAHHRAATFATGQPLSPASHPMAGLQYTHSAHNIGDVDARQLAAGGRVQISRRG